MSYCKKCGKKLNPEDKFCKGCGTPVEISNSTPSEENKPLLVEQPNTANQKPKVICPACKSDNINISVQQSGANTIN